MILALRALASSINFKSTSRTAGTSSLEISKETRGSFCRRCTISRPRRPRLRFAVSEESAMACSSCNTNWGTISLPSRNPDSDITDSAVDNGAGVEDLGGDWLRAFHHTERAEVDRTGLGDTDQQADVAAGQRHDDAKEFGGCPCQKGTLIDHGDEHQAEHRAEERA